MAPDTAHAERPDLSKNPADAERTPPSLSEAEWDVMKPLWREGPMAARDVYRHVSEDRDWAYKTVKTMLARLVKKGALEYDQVGNSYLYRAAYSREEMTGAATTSFIARVFDGALTPFFAKFAEEASDKDLQRLRDELARIQKDQKKKRTR